MLNTSKFSPNFRSLDAFYQVVKRNRQNLVFLCSLTHSRVFDRTEGNLTAKKNSFKFKFVVLFQQTRLNDLLVKLVLFIAYMMKVC